MPAEQDHGLRADHVQPDEPDLLVRHHMQRLPRTAHLVQLLDRRPVVRRLESHCVDKALPECATVRPTHRLTQRWQHRLRIRVHVERLTVLQIASLQRTTDDERLVFFLRYTKVDAIVHHLS